MPADFDSGFCVRTPSWHRQELLIPEEERPTTWAEARPLAGLDWDPEQRPVFEMTGQDEEGNPTFAQIENYHRVARSDNGATLAINRDSHALVTNGQIGEIIEAVCGQTSVEYLDYVRTARTWETRLRRSILEGEPLKAKALALAMEVSTS